MVLADKEDLKMEVYARLAPQLRLAHTSYVSPTKATMLLTTSPTRGMVQP